jgi:hypothetical protein
MALFQLDPQSILARARNSGSDRIHVPSRGESLWRGVIGFTLVSVAGFAPWAIFERWFRSMRETELYIACIVTFILASGPLLHRLIIGAGSLRRFYQLFAVAFTSYAITWIAFWVGLRGELGVLLGLLGGSAVIGAVIALAFGAPAALGKAAAAITAGNLIGYYLGEWLHVEIGWDYRYLGMAAWGVCYGAGFGAGLGYAFYAAQAPARALLTAREQASPT